MNLSQGLLCSRFSQDSRARLLPNFSDQLSCITLWFTLLSISCPGDCTTILSKSPTLSSPLVFLLPSSPLRASLRFLKATSILLGRLSSSLAHSGKWVFAAWTVYRPAVWKWVLQLGIRQWKGSLRSISEWWRPRASTVSGHRLYRWKSLFM